METSPDYTQYSLDELRETRQAIDADRFPERAAQLDLLIKDRTRGDRSNPSSMTTNQSAMLPQSRIIILALPKPNPVFYKGLLLGALVTLLAFNVLALAKGVLLALLPITLQLVVIMLVLMQHRVAVVMIRVWSGLLCASGLLYWLSILMWSLAGVLSPPSSPKLAVKLTLAHAIWNTFQLLGAYWLFRFAPQVLPDLASSKKSQHAS